MPICSYVITPAEGQSEKLIGELEAQPGCKVYPADNRELIILLTETFEQAQEEALQKFLKSNESIQCLSLSFGELEENTDAAS